MIIHQNSLTYNVKAVVQVATRKKCNMDDVKHFKGMMTFAETVVFTIDRWRFCDFIHLLKV